MNRVKAAFWRWVRDGWQKGEVERSSEAFAPDVVLHGASGETRGVDALNAVLGELRALEDRDGRFTLEAGGDQLVARYELRGRHTRTLFGVAPTEQLIELQGIVTMRTAGERIVEIWHTVSAQAPDTRAWARRWGLTLSEARVAELAMAGHGDKQIAAELALAPASVSKYLRRILRKAEVPSRAALAERAGLVRLG